MKKIKRAYSGFMEKSDLYELTGEILSAPFYSTLEGAARRLRGYERLKFGKLHIVLTWESLREKKK